MKNRNFNETVSLLEVKIKGVISVVNFMYWSYFTFLSLCVTEEKSESVEKEARSDEESNEDESSSEEESSEEDSEEVVTDDNCPYKLR